MDNKFTVRFADDKDFSLLTIHRRRMFEDMYVAANKIVPDNHFTKMEQIYPEFVRMHINDGTLYAWVIESQNQAVCSAVLSIMNWPPNLYDQSGKMAYLHSLYTEPNFRRKGAARLMMQTMIDFCRARNLRTIWLSASDFGRPLYEQLGFEDDPSGMVLYLRE
jgi:GNAT superfamily N-acetyltransferase